MAVGWCFGYPFYVQGAHQVPFITSLSPFRLTSIVSSLSKNYMSLLTPSESLAFNGFLSAVSSVDYGDAIEWGSLPSALSDHIPPARGREALSKATKDLMALEAIHDNDIKSPLMTRSPSHNQNLWPSFVSEPAPPSRNSSSGSSTTPDHRIPQQQNYTYGFALPRGRSSSASRSVNPYNTDAAPSSSQFSFQYPTPHTDSSLQHRPLSHSPSPFGLPSIQDTNLQQPQAHTSTPFSPSRPPAISSFSAPSILLNRTVSASAVPTLSKRPFPSDGHTDFDIVAKRRRSATNPTSLDIKPTLSIPHRPPSSSSSSVTATPTRQYPEFSPTLVSFHSSSVSPVSTRVPQSAAPPPSRQALLSPSQKRANHIQSEQKRRANIRRGYEALCEVVPALREAIRLEEAGLGEYLSSLAQRVPYFAVVRSASVCRCVDTFAQSAFPFVFPSRSSILNRSRRQTPGQIPPVPSWQDRIEEEEEASKGGL